MSAISSSVLFDGIRSARTTSANTLLNSLKSLGSEFSEQALSERWLKHIYLDGNVHPFGWYQPPPNGVSVLVGNPGNFERLNYRSLRDKSNYPSSAHVYNKDSIIYPYFSAIHRNTFMIGDHVATYYGGEDGRIRNWLSNVYMATKYIANKAEVGMRYSDLYVLCNEYLQEQKVINNTFSQSGGRSSDIGHTIPFFNRVDDELINEFNSLTPQFLTDRIAKDRIFISSSNERLIEQNCAFTIEPQMIADGLPMASFHLIVVFVNGERTVIEEFQSLFDFFGMTEWIKRDS